MARAIVAAADVTTAYMIVPRKIDAEPTVVAATPAKPFETRADGSNCRPINLSATNEYMMACVACPTVAILKQGPARDLPSCRGIVA